MGKTEIYKVYKTLFEMLTDRGYTMGPLPAYPEFVVMYEGGNYNIVDEDDRIYVNFFKDKKNFGKKDLETIVNKIQEDYGMDIRIIIVLRDKYNVQVENELMKDIYKYVEFFLQTDLIINITKHSLQPTFKLLSPAGKEFVLKQYMATENQIPKILATDPIAKYYGAKPGELFKIIRNSPSAGVSVSYRMVR